MVGIFSYLLFAVTLLSLPAFLATPFAHFKISPWIGSVSLLSVSPSTLSFPSSLPNNTVSSSGTATWTINLGAALLSTWTLGVSAATPACTNAPLSSITVRCTAITDVGIGVVSHSCSAATTLTSTAQTIASGFDLLAILNGHRTVSVQYSFSDLWKYTASTNPCNVTLTYVLTSS